MSRGHELLVQNQELFRHANERLHERIVAIAQDGQRIPFLCECGDPTCTELVRLSLEQYEHIRTHANWFLLATGHEPEVRGTAAHVDVDRGRRDGVQRVRFRLERGREGWLIVAIDVIVYLMQATGGMYETRSGLAGPMAGWTMIPAEITQGREQAEAAIRRESQT